MTRPLLALAAAALLAFSFVAAPAAEARDRRDRDWGYYDDDWGHGRHHRRHRDDDDGEAIAAGIIGLALGLAIGAAASDDGPDRVQAQCYDNYQRCGPSRSYYDQQGYDRSYSAYEEDYGLEGGYGPPPSADGRGGCIAQVEQWDPVAGRYVLVNLRGPCFGSNRLAQLTRPP